MLTAVARKTMQPKLRNIQPQWAMQNGRPVLVLRDPLGLSNKALALPQPLVPMLALCDGTKDEAAIRAALEIRAGVRLSPQILSDILQQLDDALLLDNERSAAALQAALHRYRSAPFRPPTLAGSGYPAEPDALAAMLQGYVDAAKPAQAVTALRGLVSPHIDYQRGGSVYGQVWAAAAEAVRQADVAVIFGTDHKGDFSPFTLTLQHYATPFGVLPTDTTVVRALSTAIGEDTAFRDEFHHKSEHSVELAAVWLHYVRGGQPCDLVPILSGTFEPFVAGQESARDSDFISRGMETLQKALQGRNVVVVAAADLAHTGPAFGNPIAAGFVQRAMGKKADASLLETLCEGDADAVLNLIQEEDDSRHICGLPPIYLALRLLEPARGHLIAYDQAPADAQGDSFVSFCGITLE
jgi:AmmeMemoRadiSam system protein B